MRFMRMFMLTLVLGWLGYADAHAGQPLLQKLEDTGTFWYHPHFNSSEQLERGLKRILSGAYL